MKALKLILAISLFSTLFGNASYAKTDLKPQQITIMQMVMSADGLITKELHSEFWSHFPREIRNDPKFRDYIVTFLKKHSLLTVRFQRETWTSMKLSIKARRVVKTTNYESVKIAILNASTLASYKRRVKISIKNAENMIKAAATGDAMNTARGKFYVTPEVVEQVLGGIEGSMARALILFNPVWQEKQQEFTYPEVHVSILSPTPFAKQRKTITANNRTMKTTILSKIQNANHAVNVMYTQMEFNFADPKGALTRMVKRTLSSMGVTSYIVSLTEFRGRLSAHGSGVFKISGETTYASVRVVEMRKKQGVLMFQGISDESKAAAILAREHLEQSTRLLRK